MPLHIALNLITLLEKCKCECCQKELKKLNEKYGLDKVNKAEGESHRERLNPEENFDFKKYNDPNDDYWKFEHDSMKEILCDSPNSENK